ncbi:MAG: dephospho-CoA kinase [Acidobacteria bacterium]|nr:dephospho-CoA kinase [Acidobacteriota bacterium]
MLKVGLTGSIAVGKSFVCSVMRELGLHVLDADQAAREVVAKGSPGLVRVVEAFGVGIVDGHGELDRKKMAAIVFADEQKRLLLNSIIHPLVIEKQNEWIGSIAQEDPGGIAVVDAALMIESGGYKRFDKLIVVWCEPEIQLERLMRRENLSRSDAAKRIGAQMPQDEKKRFANYLIDTSGSIEESRKRTERVVEKLRSLSS